MAERLGIVDTCFNMILNGHCYSKQDWNNFWGEKVWAMEDEEFQLIKGQLGKEKLLMQVIEKPYYLTWWLMADISRTCIEQYETMAQLVCDTSLLKACNLRYKKLTVASKFCDKCDLGIEENMRHIIMQCRFLKMINDC